MVILMQAQALLIVHNDRHGGIRYEETYSCSTFRSSTHHVRCTAVGPWDIYS